MTKNERKKFDEWAVGDTSHGDLLEDAGRQSPDDIEFDVDNGSNILPRMLYLKSLGYNFDTFEGYYWAEINEMANIKKVA